MAKRKPAVVEELNKDRHVLNHFDSMTRKYLLSVLTDELIEEHRRNPPHPSEPLWRLMAWCQRRPLMEQFAVKSESDGRFRIIKFSGSRGKPPLYAEEVSYQTLAEARHAAFLLHIKDLTGN